MSASDRRVASLNRTMPGSVTRLAVKAAAYAGTISYSVHQRPTGAVDKPGTVRVEPTESHAMNVFVVGDSHANPQYMLRTIEKAAESGCAAMLQVGDFGYWPGIPKGAAFVQDVSDALVRADIHLYFCDGNHEDHSRLDHDADAVIEVAPNLHYMPRGRILRLEGVNILAMGGAVSVDRGMRISGYDWFAEEVPSETQWLRAFAQKDVDIVVAHDVPDGTDLSLHHPVTPQIRYESHRIRELARELLDTVEPKLWLAGHYHQRITQQIGDTRVEVLDCEYPLSNSTLLLDLDDWRTG